MSAVVLMTVLAWSFGFARSVTKLKDPPEVNGGLITEGDDGIYSFYKDSVRFDYLDEFLRLYKTFLGYKVPLAQLIGYTGCERNGDECDLYYKNVFKMDKQVTWNDGTFVPNFISVLEGFAKAKKTKLLPLEVDSMMYNPVSRRFEFVGLAEFYKSSEKLIDQKYFFSLLLEKMVSDLQNSNFDYTEKDKYALQSFTDVTKEAAKAIREKVIGKGNAFDSSRYLPEFVESATSEASSKESSSLTVSYRKVKSRTSSQKSTLLLEYTIEGKTKEWGRASLDSDAVSLFLCNVVIKVQMSCHPLKVKKGQDSQEWFYYSGKNGSHLKVEVQSGTILSGYTESYFYEIYLIITPGNFPSLTLSEISHQVKKFDENTEYLFYLCESHLGLFQIRTSEPTNFEKQYFEAKRHVEIDKDLQIFQVKHSSVDITTCPKFARSIYGVILSKKKSLFVVDETTDSNAGLFIHDSSSKPEPFFSNACQTSEPDIQIIEKIGENTLKFGGVEITYPKEVVIKSSKKTSNDIISCIRHRNGGFFPSYSYPGQTNFLFVWNFGSHTKEDYGNEKQSLLYLVPWLDEMPTFSVGKFEYLQKGGAKLLLSISKKAGKAKVYVTVLHLNDKGEFKLIPNSIENVNFPVTKFKITKDKADVQSPADAIKEPTEGPLSQVPVVYLSEEEVVYKLNVNKLENCSYQLKYSENDNLFEVECSKLEFMKGLLGKNKNIDFSVLPEGIRLMHQLETSDPGAKHQNLIL